MLQETLVQPLVDDRQKMLSYVRRWGDVNTDGLLEDAVKPFYLEGFEGFIGYTIHSGNAIVFGDPVCAPDDQETFAFAFQEWCQNQGIGVVYTIVSQEFAEWAALFLDAVQIEFGEKFILNPQENPATNKGSKAGLLRKKMKHVAAEGVTVQEYTGHEPEVETSIENVAKEWLQKRKGPQIYLCQVRIFQDRMGKRYFYAKQAGRTIGLVILNEMKEKNGWLLNNVMIVKDAPNGLSEALVMTALQTVQKEGCTYLLIGPVPSKELGKITGVGQIPATLTRWLFKTIKYIFHLEGHATFWQKFQPKVEGSYLIFPQRNLGLSSIKSVLSAYNVGKGS